MINLSNLGRQSQVKCQTDTTRQVRHSLIFFQIKNESLTETTAQNDRNTASSVKIHLVSKC